MAPGLPRLGAIVGDTIVDLAGVDGLPATMLGLLEAGPEVWQAAALAAERGGSCWPLDELRLHPPLPRPPSVRDFYAFESHVAAAFANRDKPVPPEWFEFPVFYFSNPGSIVGPEDQVAAPPGSQALDYELEVACVIGRGGRDIPAGDAGRHIFGYTILNDWSARDLQQQEMRVGLGPAKGKDFATSLGPCLVTPDELGEPTGRVGVYDLEMTARVNGKEKSRGRLADIHYSFGDDRLAASGADLFRRRHRLGHGRERLPARAYPRPRTLAPTRRRGRAGSRATGSAEEYSGRVAAAFRLRVDAG
jgi:fumarylacetoacetate (FAA) hydrolase